MRKYACSVMANPTAREQNWTREDVTWSDLVEMAASPADHKDCGGYVMGALTGPTRTKDTIASRSALTLDADRVGDAEAMIDGLDVLGWNAIVHTTWRSEPDSTRLRVIIPTSREMSPGEYRRVSRAVVEALGAENFDVGSSTEPERFMWRPSSNGYYKYWELGDGDLLDVDAILAGVPEPEPATEPEDVGDYTGPDYGDLGEDLRRAADEYVAEMADTWREHFAGMEDWEEGQRDEAGRGWEANARDFAWALARDAAARWSPLDEDTAEGLYLSVLPTAIRRDRKCRGKWYDGIVGKAARSDRPNLPPWLTGDRGTPGEDFDPLDDNTGSNSVDVTDESAALEWAQREVGRRALSGVFNRNNELVHTPQINEDGYVFPDEGGDDGRVQVRRILPLELATRIDTHYRVVKRTQRGAPRPCLFPQVVANRAASSPDLLAGARPLEMVTHTPFVRADGTVVTLAGYDSRSGVLYLPGTLEVRRVPESPTRADVAEAVSLLREMITDFPFKTADDRANYLGLLMTPLLRLYCPPPYKLAVIDAPQRGSGKSLLARLMRIIHGGVFRAALPDGEETRKAITALLDTTTGPIIQFDNVTGRVASPHLDALMTSRDWSDRLLGQGRSISLSNDRLWVMTGNNVGIGGDLSRRTIWVTIDANTEHPENRTDFKHLDLPGWVESRRGDLLHALLVLVRHWVVNGQPATVTTADDYGRWVSVVRGVLDASGMDDVGQFASPNLARVASADTEEEEWATFLRAAHRVYGSEPWTTKELVRCLTDDELLEDGAELPDDKVLYSEMPGNLAEKAAGSGSRAGLGLSLGRWLINRDGRWAGGLSVRGRVDSHLNMRVWTVHEN